MAKIGAGPMQENNIAPEEVEAEVQRRRESLGERNTHKSTFILLPIIILAILIAVAYGFSSIQH